MFHKANVGNVERFSNSSFNLQQKGSVFVIKFIITVLVFDIHGIFLQGKHNLQILQIHA